MRVVWRNVQRHLCTNTAIIVAMVVVLMHLLPFPLANGQLILNLTSNPNGQSSAVKYISYCLKCPDPSKEGSLLLGLNSKFGPQRFSITGELIYCVPNYGDRERLLNSHQFSERIVMVERGKVSMLEKVLRIQHQSEATAILIADDGSCDESFLNCGPRLGSQSEGGFAAFDDAMRWREVEIPVLLVSQASAEKLRNLMKIKQLFVRGYGNQNVTMVDEMETDL